MHELFTGHHGMRLLALLRIYNSAAPLLELLLGDYILLFFGWRANFFRLYFRACRFHRVMEVIAGQTKPGYKRLTS